MGTQPHLSKGYHLALADLSIEVGTVVYSGAESYRMARDAQVSSLVEAMQASAMGRMKSSASHAPLPVRVTNARDVTPVDECGTLRPGAGQD